MRSSLIITLLLTLLVTVKSNPEDEKILQKVYKTLTEKKQQLQQCLNQRDRLRDQSSLSSGNIDSTTIHQYEVRVRDLSDAADIAKEEIYNLKERLSTELRIRESLQITRNQLDDRISNLEMENIKVKRQAAMHRDAAIHLGEFYDKAKGLWREAAQVVCSC